MVVNKLVMLLTTFLFGLLLDYDNLAFRYIYPVIGILGIISIFLLSLIRTDNIQSDDTYTGLKDSLKKILRIITKNKAYRDFEIGFMFYGFAFMSSKVLITLFYDKILHLNYSSTAFYSNFYVVVMILTLPLFGKLVGHLDPRKFAMITFSFMLLTILFTSLTEYFPFVHEMLGIKLYYLLMIASLFYGLFGASMTMLWHIGSAYFCSNREAATYQSIHLSLTGLRGLFAPLIGIFLLEISNFKIAFGIGMLSVLIAIVLMKYSIGNSAK